MRFIGCFLGVALVVAACGDTSSGPCTLTAIGAACVKDTDCCSGWCQLYDTGAYCQAKQNPAPACIDMNGFCTQNRNCCSGLCQNGMCFGGAGGPACLSLGSTCIQNDSCCSNNCVGSTQGTACAPAPQPDGGLACGLPGAACSHPGQNDPTECCFGPCGLGSVCMGNSGGGGPNCGGLGAACSYGADCCSGQCSQHQTGGSCD
jgi:hypothetical protein